NVRVIGVPDVKGVFGLGAGLLESLEEDLLVRFLKAYLVGDDAKVKSTPNIQIFEHARKAAIPVGDDSEPKPSPAKVLESLPRPGGKERGTRGGKALVEVIEEEANPRGRDSVPEGAPHDFEPLFPEDLIGAGIPSGVASHEAFLPGCLEVALDF